MFCQNAFQSWQSVFWTRSLTGHLGDNAVEFLFTNDVVTRGAAIGRKYFQKSFIQFHPLVKIFFTPNGIILEKPNRCCQTFTHNQVRIFECHKWQLVKDAAVVLKRYPLPLYCNNGNWATKEHQQGVAANDLWLVECLFSTCDVHTQFQHLQQMSYKSTPYNIIHPCTWSHVYQIDPCNHIMPLFLASCRSKWNTYRPLYIYCRTLQWYTSFLALRSVLSQPLSPCKCHPRNDTENLTLCCCWCFAVDDCLHHMKCLHFSHCIRDFKFVCRNLFSETFVQSWGNKFGLMCLYCDHTGSQSAPKRQRYL